MEKRTLLAFALSFLVLIIWMTLFSPAPPPPPPPSEVGPGTAEGPSGAVQPAPPETAPATPAPQAAAPARMVLPSDVAEKEITVETPLYRAVWSNVKGALKSFQLKDYHVEPDPASPLVDLAALEGTYGTMAFSFAREGAPEPAAAVYEASATSLSMGTGSEPKDLVLTGRTPEGLVLEHTYRFYPDRYKIEVETRVINRGEAPVGGSITANLLNRPTESGSAYNFNGTALLVDGDLEQIKPKDLKKEDKNLTGPIKWVGYETDYFISAVVPAEVKDAAFLGKALPTGVIDARYIGPAVRLGPQELTTSRFQLYLGPRDLTYLKAFGNELDKAVNFGWTDVIARPLLYALRFFNDFVHNYGLSIIILTVLIKILFWPLTHKSYKSMKEMQKIQPLMAKIRDKYKGNREQMNREMMQLYKTYKVNPMGGCLPMVIQIPVFFALFRILGSSIELRHAPFFLWINDLSAPDRLFHLPFSIPFMEPPAGIPVLTLLMGASMFIQQKMTPTPGDPTQAKVMMFLPIIFTFVFINFPSGLVLYWLTNNILSIGQQYRILKQSA